MTEKIRISNDRLWSLAQSRVDVDEYLEKAVGIGNYTEHFGIFNLPYRVFSFRNESDAIMFSLKFL
jgi:hypothetical protein